MKRDRNGKGAAPAEEVPPPPPPRKPTSNGFTRGATPPAPSSTAVAGVSKTNGVRGGGGGGGGSGRGRGGGRGGAKPAVAARPTGTASSSSASKSAAGKRTKLALDRLEGWRAAADEILARAGGGTGGGAGSGIQGNGVSAWCGTRGGDAAGRPASRRKFAAVCSANFNRSMMAHKLLQEHRFFVKSYGTGRDVRLPGKDASTPEVFPFGTPYREIFDTLRRKDEDFFLRNNLLPLVARNATIKAAPQRFQEIEGPDMAGFDVVLCFDSRVFYLVVEDLQSRDPETFKPLHVVNMTIKDSPEESAAAAGDVLELCRTLDGLSQLEEKAAGVLETFCAKSKRTVLHQVCHV